MSDQDQFAEYHLYTAEEIKKNSMTTPPPSREEKLLSRTERLQRWINTVNN